MDKFFRCINGHHLTEGDKFCGDCGEYRTSSAPLPCGTCGVIPNRRTVYCTNCGVINAPLPSKHSQYSSHISKNFGRNHDVIKRAVAPRVGQVLKTAEIMALVLKLDPHFNPGSLLPNDHGGGNRGGCGCSLYKAGPDAEPIFERVSSGRYLVLGEAGPINSGGDPAVDDRQTAIRTFEQLFHLNGAPKNESTGEVSNGLRASEWMRSEAIAAIDQIIGSNTATSLSGTKGGRYLAVGVRLPIIPGLEYFSPYWAIGLDTKWDFVLGQQPAPKAMYYGVRCSQNVRGVLGDTANNALAPLLDGRWERPDQFWAIWKSSTELNPSRTLLTSEEFLRNILQQFADGYKAITSHFALME